MNIMDDILENLKEQETLIEFELQNYNDDQKEELVNLAKSSVNEAIQYLEELNNI